ncbi:MAG TPA: hypothetical protein VFI02_18840, partial [Armatimonadota bacterium]|nr:hypothetical protein [Armatimonadota bacterium]
VIFVIRTPGNPLASRPSRPLALTMVAVVLAAVLLTYSYLGRILGFVPPPALLLFAIAALTVTYLGLVQLVKAWFYKRHSLM